MAPAKRHLPEGYHTVTPILTLEDCAAALDWYGRALGAEDVAKSLGPDGKVMHAEFRIGASKLMAHDTMMGGRGPRGFGGSPMALWIYVEDCDALFQRAVAAGATVVRPVEDQFWGDRCGTLKDPHGYAWTVATHKEDLSRAEMDARAAEFFKNFAPAGKGGS
ncbi:MAG: VOC family protein [Candidatus Eisenbacteria bacterium]|nr:VOC family protein [Candidatus Eisenbacteria bacterium]